LAERGSTARPMVATVIDGKTMAKRLRADVKKRVTTLVADSGIIPGLAVISVGDDPASQIYLRNKLNGLADVGMRAFEHSLAGDTTQEFVLDLIHKLNNDLAVHGILVQIPLPSHIDIDLVIRQIRPDKDVDGLHDQNMGQLLSQGGLVPCTPLGCIAMLKDQLGDLSGLHAVVVGRSRLVGKPLAQLLLREHCTITVTHSHTRNLPTLCRMADILIAAAGRPKLIQGEWIKPGATVIDVGINRIQTDDGKIRLIGDVDFDAALKKAGAITPVPGGVGPMTIACLLLNTLQAAVTAQSNRI